MKHAHRLRRLEDRLLAAQVAAIELLDDADLWLFCEGSGRILTGGPMTPDEAAMMQRWQKLMAELLRLPAWQHAARDRMVKRLRMYYMATQRAELKRTPPEHAAALRPPPPPALAVAPGCEPTPAEPPPSHPRSRGTSRQRGGSIAGSNACSNATKVGADAVIACHMWNGSNF